MAPSAVPHPPVARTSAAFSGVMIRFGPMALSRGMAGSFSSAGLNILGADVFTRGDSLVLDIFRVCTPRHEAVTDAKEMAQVEKRLAQSLEAEEFDFQPYLEKAFKRRAVHLAELAGMLFLGIRQCRACCRQPGYQIDKASSTGHEGRECN